MKDSKSGTHLDGAAALMLARQNSNFAGFTFIAPTVRISWAAVSALSLMVVALVTIGYGPTGQPAWALFKVYLHKVQPVKILLHMHIRHPDNTTSSWNSSVQEDTAAAVVKPSESVTAAGLGIPAPAQSAESASGPTEDYITPATVSQPSRKGIGQLLDASNAPAEQLQRERHQPHSLNDTMSLEALAPQSSRAAGKEQKGPRTAQGNSQPASAPAPEGESKQQQQQQQGSSAQRQRSGGEQQLAAWQNEAYDWTTMPDDSEPLPKGKKYMVHQLTRGGIDNCEGHDHQMAGLSCVLREAKLLGRTFVMPYTLCIPGKHQPDGRGIVFPAHMLLDFKALAKDFDIVVRQNMTRVLDVAEAQGLSVSGEIGRRTYPSDHIGNTTDVLYRVRGGGSGDFWWKPCEDDPEVLKTELSTYQYETRIQPAQQLLAAAERIRGRIGEYDALHVRRGDKARQWKFPGLDNDTQPEAVLESIKPFSPAGSTLWLSTDEPDPHFFSLLHTQYKVYQWRDFTEELEKAGIPLRYQKQDPKRWGRWWACNPETGYFVDAPRGGETGPVEPQDCTNLVAMNSQMLYMVDKDMLRHARLYMDTFNYLTDLPKHGLDRAGRGRLQRPALSPPGAKPASSELS